MVVGAASRSDTAARPAASVPSSIPTASGAPTDTAPPAPIPLSALPGLLLDVGTVNQIEGATDIALKPDPDNSRTFAGLNNDRPDCGGIQGPALEAALQSSGWIGVRTQMLQDPGAKAHMIINAVINYPTAKAASDFAAHQAQAWARCSGATLHASAPEEPPSIWTVGTVSERDGMLSVTNIEEGGQGWACQRALTVRNNIVIDARSCGENRTDQAITAATRIAERVSASG